MLTQSERYKQLRLNQDAPEMAWFMDRPGRIAFAQRVGFYELVREHETGAPIARLHTLPGGEDVRSYLMHRSKDA